MNESKKYLWGHFLLLLMLMSQATIVLAKSDDLLQREIEVKLAKSDTLQDTSISVYVEDSLVVLSGQVRLYEHKLISDRIAWTTHGVFEVDNEIRVVPGLPLSDGAIELRIRDIVNAEERFNAAVLVIRVNNGAVFLKGRFLGYRDPSVLKHKIAEIEGVVAIEIGADFLAGPADIDGHTYSFNRP